MNYISSSSYNSFLIINSFSTVSREVEEIFETVTVTVRVTVYLKHIEISGEDSIVVLSCKKFRYGKWKILKMSPEADQNPSNEEREIERQRRKVIHEKD